jgi:hypothetical protein
MPCCRKQKRSVYVVQSRVTTLVSNIELLNEQYNCAIPTFFSIYKRTYFIASRSVNYKVHAFAVFVQERIFFKLCKYRHYSKIPKSRKIYKKYIMTALNVYVIFVLAVF